MLSKLIRNIATKKHKTHKELASLLCVFVAIYWAPIE